MSRRGFWCAERLDLRSRLQPVLAAVLRIFVVQAWPDEVGGRDAAAASARNAFCEVQLRLQAVAVVVARTSQCQPPGEGRPGCGRSQPEPPASSAPPPAGHCRTAASPPRHLRVPTSRWMASRAGQAGGGGMGAGVEWPLSPQCQLLTSEKPGSMRNTHLTSSAPASLGSYAAFTRLVGAVLLVQLEHWQQEGLPRGLTRLDDRHPSRR